MIQALQAVEGFTYSWRLNAVPAGLNHKTAPRLSRILLSESSGAPDAETVGALTFLFGIGYQLFDIEAKIRRNSQSLEDAIANAVADLEHWQPQLPLSP